MSYHTLFGIVPLAIVMLMVFQSMPSYSDIGNDARAFLYKQAELGDIEYPVKNADGTESEETIKLTEQIDSITDNFMAKLDTGTITLFSGAFVIWAALGLLGTIERSFNAIWHAPKGRGFMHRIVNYWGLLTLGPLLLGLGIYASTHYLTQSQIQVGAMRYIRMFLPYMLSVVALFFLYFVMPNTKVSAKSALWAAAVAALIWTIAKIAFRLYVSKFKPHFNVYGAVGLVPLGVLWIYVTWLIVLFGLQLTYVSQHLKSLNAAELAKVQKPEENFIANDITAIRIMTYIAGQFEQKKGPVNSDAIAGVLEMPADFTERILGHFVAAGLLFETSQPHRGYAPAGDPGKITLEQVSAAVTKAAFGQNLEDNEGFEKLLTSRKQSFAGQTIGDLLKKVDQQPA